MNALRPATPRPTRPIAQRLEHVRERIAKIPTLKAFAARLLEAPGGFEVSYSAVRNYHFDRDAPADYLARVAKVFGVSLEWLITGEGEPTAFAAAVRNAEEGSGEGDDEAVEAEILAGVERRITEVFPLFDELDRFTRTHIWQAVQVVFDDLAASIDRETPPGEELVVEAADLAVQAGEIVARSLLTPLALLPNKTINPRHFEQYCVLICQALMIPAWSPPQASDDPA